MPDVLKPVRARRSGLRPVVMAVLAAAGIGVLIGAWIGSNPPGSAPDEPTHYVKAIGVATGQLAGHRTSEKVPGQTNDLQRRWISMATRRFDIPAGLAPAPGLACTAFKPTLPATCLSSSPRSGSAPASLSYAGTYQPFAYMIPGLAARLGSDSISGLYLARAANGAVAALLLIGAVAVLWSPRARGHSVVGLVVAVTPMVIFMAASLSPSAIEICASVCWYASIIRILRGDRRPAWVWVALALSGGLVASARSLGPLWVAIGAGLLVADRGLGFAIDIIREEGRRAWIAVVVILAGVAAGGIWELTVEPHPGSERITGALLADIGGQGLHMLREAIGYFGYLDTRLPSAVYGAWEVMALVLIVVAVTFGTRRERLVIGSCLAAVVATLYALGVEYLRTGFAMQARFLLPVAVLVPLYCGEVIGRNRARFGAASARTLPAGTAIAAGVMQAAAWYTNARRYAVGTSGPIWFRGRSMWAPPIGWAFWGSLVAAGGACLVAAGLVALVAPEEKGGDAEAITYEGRNDPVARIRAVP